MTDTQKATELIGFIDQVLMIHRFVGFVSRRWGKSKIDTRTKYLDFGHECFQKTQKGYGWTFLFPNNPGFLALQKELKENQYNLDLPWPKMVSNVKPNSDAKKERYFLSKAGNLFYALAVDIIASTRTLAQELFNLTDTELEYLTTKNIVDDLSLEKDKLLTLGKRAVGLLQKKTSPQGPTGDHGDKNNETPRKDGKKINAAIEKAYRQWEKSYAINPTWTDKEIYNILAQESDELPSQETWVKYVQRGRRYHGTRKNHPRWGRGGGSIVKVQDCERTPVEDE